MRSPSGGRSGNQPWGCRSWVHEFTAETGIVVQVQQILWASYQDQVFVNFGNKQTDFDIVVDDSHWLARGARIKRGSRVGTEYEFEPMADGEDIELGSNVLFKVFETSGYSPESISSLAYDRTASSLEEPQVVITGDALW